MPDSISQQSFWLPDSFWVHQFVFWWPPFHLIMTSKDKNEAVRKIETGGQCSDYVWYFEVLLSVSREETHLSIHTVCSDCSVSIFSYVGATREVLAPKDRRGPCSSRSYATEFVHPTVEVWKWYHVRRNDVGPPKQLDWWYHVRWKERWWTTKTTSSMNITILHISIGLKEEDEGILKEASLVGRSLVCRREILF